MKKLVVLLALTFSLSACTIPTTPSGVDVSREETTFSKEVFDVGGKALVIIRAYNNLASDQASTYLTFKNEAGDTYYVAVKNGVSTAVMLPFGDYEVIDHSLYFFERIANTTHTISMDDIHKKFKTKFSIKKNELVYVGALVTDLGRTGKTKRSFFGNKTSAMMQLRVRVSDDSEKIPLGEIYKYEEMTGKPFALRLMQVTPVEAK